jgi:DNA (cytosine-5)-methyltransferase 1
LAKNFPNTERYEDIRTVGKHNLEPVDIISGGFPCQDISIAGKKAGIAGEKSGLWTEMFRVCRELRPRFIIIENVRNLVRLGLKRVLYDLASIRYDAEWTIISAKDIGAWHKRERIWIIAYPNKLNGNYSGFRAGEILGKRLEKTEIQRGSQKDFVPNAGDERDVERKRELSKVKQAGGNENHYGIGTKIDALREWWKSEPGVDRVANGIPNRMDRLRGLGNAIVPQIAEFIGRLILRQE